MSLEGRVKRKEKNARMTKWQRGILTAVGAVGVLSIALLAPNAVRTVAPLLKELSKSKRQAIARARTRLVMRGLLEYEKERHGFIRLTAKGRAVLHRLEMCGYQIPVPKQWDGRWRVLIFDISEKRKTVRHEVRRTLSAVGFMRAQDSVWIYPYPCEEFVSLLKADFELGYSLLYLIVEELEGEARFRRSFNLSENDG